MTSLADDLEHLKKEYDQLMATCEALKASKADIIKNHEEITTKLTMAITEKDENLAKNNMPTGNCINLLELSDESFKTRPKRRTGSSQNIQIPACEYPSCSEINVDLVMCSACSRFVCEECNSIPINKLKNMVQICKTLYFLCSDCNTNKTKTVLSNPGKTLDDQDGENSENLREEAVDKMKIIKTLEAGQKALNDLVEDRNVVIKSQKTILENDRIELSNIKEELIEAKRIIAMKEEEVSIGCASQNAVKKLEVELGDAKSSNQILKKKLQDQISLT